MKRERKRNFKSVGDSTHLYSQLAHAHTEGAVRSQRPPASPGVSTSQYSVEFW